MVYEAQVDEMYNSKKHFDVICWKILAIIEIGFSTTWF